jgi:DNA replication and repair protein RecF
MILESLKINNIRNHSLNEFSFPQNGILLWGENGAGKTAVLESISLLCTSKSFATNTDKSIIRNTTDGCSVNGDLKATGGSRHSVKYTLPAGPGRRQILLDNASLNSSVDLIGRFPVVALSPQYRAITNGGPSERRSFMDFVISQAHHSYLLDLVEYKKVVKHRNALLSDNECSYAKTRSLIAPWNEQFAVLAVRIIRQRLEFVTTFLPIFQDAFHSVVPEREEPALRYVATIDADVHNDKAAGLVLEQLEHAFDYELKRRVTTIGPHRDDIEILINGMDARECASQGQHKSLLIALKLGEYYYLTQRLDEQPILLLDDVFSELDNVRLARIMNLIGSLGQTFISSASDAVAEHFPDMWSDTLMLHVREGQIISEGVNA